MKTIHIGDVQNSLVRFILWKIGEVPTSVSRLQAAEPAAIAYFGGWCAYCGDRKPVHFDHAIPINRDHLGQHCIGNLIPSCAECNDKKGGRRDFRDFLSDRRDGEQRTAKILAYMEVNDYMPLGDDPELKSLIQVARADAAKIADKYITAINLKLGDNPSPRRPSPSNPLVASIKIPKNINGSTHNAPVLEQIKAIRERNNRSWSNLRKGCLDQMGVSVPHGTPKVRASSRTFAKKASEATGLKYPEIVALLDQHALGLER